MNELTKYRPSDSASELTDMRHKWSLDNIEKEWRMQTNKKQSPEFFLLGPHYILLARRSLYIPK